MGIAAPRMVKARSSGGRVKPGYVFKMLRINGFEPFEPVALVHAAVTRDKRGVPISRAVEKGVLLDVTWWKGPVGAWSCLGCTLADGRVREIRRTTRPAAVRSDNRVPTVQTAGHWHPSCLRAKLANHGRYGHDVKQHATKLEVSK